MPTMEEIYHCHSKEYDELVTCEDHEKNLDAALFEIADFREAKVLEFGVGTGRLTRIFARESARVFCCDSSIHMLEAARRNLAPWSAKIDFLACDNLCLPSLNEEFNLAIEGWSFGHMVPEELGEIPGFAGRLLKTCTRYLSPKGQVVIIETLGTNVDRPAPTKPRLQRFFDLLENEYGFERKTIRTDYRFSSNEEAARIMGFFFGDRMRESVRQRGSDTIPEFTGIWSRRCQARTNLTYPRRPHGE